MTTDKPKTTKKLAMYRAVAHHEDHTCGNCQSMQPDGSCKKVRGMVDRRHVCDLWEPEEVDGGPRNSETDDHGDPV